MLKIDQMYFENLAVFTARFLKYVWPFFNIIYERAISFQYVYFAEAPADNCKKM